MNKKITNRFKELNVNPYINRFVIVKDYKINTNIDNIIKDYCKTHNTDYELLISFAKFVDYDFDNLNINLFKEIITKKVFSLEQIDLIKNFLKYYLLGVDEK